MIRGEDEQLIDLWHTFIRVFTEGKRKMEEAFARASIKPVEVRILYILREEKECSLNRIAELSNMSPAWITDTIDTLEEKGLITKVRNRNDRRFVNVTLTEEGQSKLAECEKIYIRFLREALDGLTEEEIDEFRKILEKVERSF
ncbi:hypothetical protein GCM10007108_06100 [Thermogymnomonas acidicola]|uniref:HTH marR-type domain-containing protein n=1 Tax=Thermogymnomonas acidicola TaxID=399579 RepID=A0AA37BQR9_9ARCH|nr:MarR family transcriptional regulator [Thermogymnomonas acidicola]GGM70841.1 hypothetical protein GCM10007108_06100 [Thermogymnomonas acidicola]